MQTVVVQCNYPNGLTLQINGGKNTFVVKGYQNATIIQGGYGLTADVPKDFWDQWLKENEAFPIYQNGCVLAQGSIKSSIAEAKANKTVKSGNEQIPQPKGDNV